MVVNVLGVNDRIAPGLVELREAHAGRFIRHDEL